MKNNNAADAIDGHYVVVEVKVLMLGSAAWRTSFRVGIDRLEDDFNVGNDR